MMQITMKKLILASGSPRRQQLLREAGIPFEVRVREVDESFPSDLPPEKVAAFLARKKALASRSFLRKDEILLTADSTVLLGETILNKPVDYGEAVGFLRALSGQMHRVVTGVCLMDSRKERVFSDISRVYFHELSAEEIDYYVSRYEPYDKAGAYAIQEWIGLCRVRKIEGSYFNVMGLPVDRVYEALKKF